MDSTQQSPLTSISIGPGIRGIERGVERVTGRITPLAFVEIEAFIIENLVCEMESGLLDSAPIWSNVKTFNAVPFRGVVDFIFAGYPCQPFSSAGKRRGLEDPRHLYPHIERTIDIIRPLGCFFENVRGHVSLGLHEVIESLERLGYRVHWGIFSAEETGASHKRERVFILAIMADSKSFIRRLQLLAGGQRKNISESFGPSEAVVSRPGQPQQAWEHPRVISREVESAVGLSIDGYNFREDILRALGNSIYIDTAELAFRTLLTKHLTNG